MVENEFFPLGAGRKMAKMTCNMGGCIPWHRCDDFSSKDKVHFTPQIVDLRISLFYQRKIKDIRFLTHISTKLLYDKWTAICIS